MSTVRGVPLLLREGADVTQGAVVAPEGGQAVAARCALQESARPVHWGRERPYFRHYGVPPARLFPTPYCVDNSYFEERAATLALDRPRLRLNFGITDDAPVVLFCGKFNEQKQPLLLLEAFERVRLGTRGSSSWATGRFVLLPRKSSLSAVSQTFVSLAS